MTDYTSRSKTPHLFIINNSSSYKNFLLANRCPLFWWYCSRCAPVSSRTSSKDGSADLRMNSTSFIIISRHVCTSNPWNFLVCDVLAAEAAVAVIVKARDLLLLPLWRESSTGCTVVMGGSFSLLIDHRNSRIRASLVAHAWENITGTEKMF